jgi:hypothetical protein
MARQCLHSGRKDHTDLLATQCEKWTLNSGWIDYDANSLHGLHLPGMFCICPVSLGNKAKWWEREANATCCAWQYSSFLCTMYLMSPAIINETGADKIISVQFNKVSDPSWQCRRPLVSILCQKLDPRFQSLQEILNGCWLLQSLDHSYYITIQSSFLVINAYCNLGH